MDYHSIHGYDVSSFAVSETHRLPTVSASQALNDLQSTPARSISTGLQSLDDALLGQLPSGSPGSSPSGGVKRGQVTEVWGPPGTGRTALGVQLAASAICDGGAVVWVDCFQPFPLGRLNKVIASVRSSRKFDKLDSSQDDHSRKLLHHSCLTLPHLMALVTRPTKDSFSADVSLVVISMASALLNSTLPKTHDGKTHARGNKGLSMPAKRLQVLQFMMNSLQKLAATRNCAVVLLSQCATKMQVEKGAALVPAVNATVWEQGVSTRLVLHRDWIWQKDALIGSLVAGIQKLDGKPAADRLEQVSAFTVEADGISEVPYDAIGIENVGHLKRKLEQTDLEIPASDEEDDDDYDFANEDEHGTALFSRKWQGSEDILLGRELAQSDEELEPEEEDATPQSDGEADA
ncbi:hypothetical protein S40288_04015 [Stachybotrys chartarum IBT 40288]|nr:hypothetical protein S40288_04015 [Stachybotrys chartarum IBT 40288]